MVKVMCGMQFNNRKRAKDLILMFGFNEAMDLLVMAVCNDIGVCG